MKPVWAALASMALMVVTVCWRSATVSRPLKSGAAERAARRAYDGAPPVVPHVPFGMACVACHTDQAVQVPGVGLSPPMPHAETPGMSRESNCRQCHVFRQTQEVLIESGFVGLAQDLERGDRPYPGAPPRISHGIFMREACAACHAGPAAREELRFTHPERSRCVQCHVPAGAVEDFVR